MKQNRYLVNGKTNNKKGFKMEVSALNTVQLDLNTYNELYAIKNEMLNNKVACYFHIYQPSSTSSPYGTTYSGNYTFFTKDEVVKKLSDDINKLDKHNVQLNNEIFDLKNPKPQSKDLTVDQIKKMSLFQLIIWKLKN